MTGQQFNTLISVMYVGYVLMQVPSCVAAFLNICRWDAQGSAETYSSINLEDHPHTFPSAFLCGVSFPSVQVSEH